MAAPGKYPDELRDRAVRMAVDLSKDPETSLGAIKRVADQLGIHPEALRDWVQRAEIDEGLQPGVTSSEAARIAELEREIKELRRANLILKSVSAFSPRNSTAPCADRKYIDQHKEKFGVESICRVLREAGAKLAPSTFYARKTRQPSARSIRDEQVSARIEQVHEDNYGVYGIRKIHVALAREGGVRGRHVAHCSVQHLMKASGLKGISRS